jgi:hypothetical protein
MARRPADAALFDCMEEKPRSQKHGRLRDCTGAFPLFDGRSRRTTPGYAVIPKVNVQVATVLGTRQ